MNDILSKLEKLSESDLTYIFEYIIQLINIRKVEKRLKTKHLKHKENLTINFQANTSSVRSAEN